MGRRKNFIVRNRMSPKHNGTRHWVHANDYHEIYILKKGDVTFNIGGIIYHLEPGDMLILGAQELRCVNENPELDYARAYVYYSPEYFAGFNTRCFNPLDIFGPKHDRKNIIGADVVRKYKLDEKMREICELSVSERPEKVVLLTAKLLELLVEVNAAFDEYYATGGEEQRDSVENDKINDVILYISEHLDEKITLEDLVDKFYISKGYLCHEFKRHTGMTVLNYIRYKKMLAAKNQLASGAPLNEVWAEFGFKDYSNFYRNFKKTFNKSPQDFIDGL